MNLPNQLDSSSVKVECTNDLLFPHAQQCAQKLGLTVNSSLEAAYSLNFAMDGVSLYLSENNKKALIRVDFCSGKEAHRRIYGGGKGQMIAKAVGLSSKIKPSVFDATAGLGRDAFVLASLGSNVVLMERSPIAFALLYDGLSRGEQFAQENDSELYAIFQKMKLISGDSSDYLKASKDCVADVIYLDPMFPLRQKSAAVKKDMQAFHSVIGHDMDESVLFACAEHKASHRVVVKRSRYAPMISSAKPSYSLDGKSSRFDIYAYKGFGS